MHDKDHREELQNGNCIYADGLLRHGCTMPRVHIIQTSYDDTCGIVARMHLVSVVLSFFENVGIGQ